MFHDLSVVDMALCQSGHWQAIIKNRDETTNPMPQPEQDHPSLQRPPIYRRMLAASDPLHVTRTTLLVAMVASFVAAVIGQAWFLYHYEEQQLDLLGVAVRTGFIFANSLVLGRFVSRWLGSWTGTAAALAFCSTFSVVLGISGNLQTLCLTGLMYCFARLAVPGRAMLDESVTTRRVCRLLLAFLIVGYGYSSGLVVLGTWFLYSLISQNLRLFTRRFRSADLVLVGVAVGISIWLGGPMIDWDDSYLRQLASTRPLSVGHFAILLLPWWPLLIGVIFITVRYGHYATPLFQLVAAWLLTTIFAVLLGILPRELGLILLTPPLAFAVAPVLVPVFRLVARRRWW